MGRPRLENRTDRKRPITVSVSPRDRAAIEERAAIAGLPLSGFVRSAALGQAVRANRILHHEQVLALAKVNADQGRLGGLLKLWLTDRPGRGAPEVEVRRLLNAIRGAQTRLAEIMERL